MKKFLIILLVFILGASPALSTNLYVSSTYGTDTNTGLSWETAKSNLQSLVIKSGQRNVFNIGAGDYRFTNLAVTLVANNTLRGTNRAEVTLIAALTNRALSIGTNCWIEAVTITGASNIAAGAAGNGGGVYASLDTIITNCNIVSNYAIYAAGVQAGKIYNSFIGYNRSPNLGGGAYLSEFFDCEIAYNYSPSGSGIANSTNVRNSLIHHNMGSAFVSSTAYGSVISNNTAAGNGGGGYSSAFFDCIISHNSSATNASGGGLYAGFASNCIISMNIGGSGGGGAANSRLIDCIVVSNRHINTGSGGGLLASYATNCFIAYNYSPSYGGGMRDGTSYNCLIVSNVAASLGDASYRNVLFNCTVVGHTNNRAPVVAERSAQLFANNILWGNASNIFAVSTNLISNYTNDPLFLYTSGTNMFKLQASSPCIDAGNDTYATMPYDFYRRTRIYGTHVDIGAVEWYPEDVPIVETTTGKKRALLNWFLWAY